VDEVLAVGDLPFQIKCFERIDEIRTSGTSVVVVSHNLNAVRHLCSRVMVIDGGAPRFVGPTSEGISHYLQILDDRKDEDVLGSTAPVRILRTELLDASGNPTVHLAGGDEVIVRVEAEVLRPLLHPYPVFSIAIHTDAGLLVYQEGSYGGVILPDGRRYDVGERVTCDIRFNAKVPTGTYSAQASVSYGPGPDTVRRSQLILFYVDGRSLLFGVADLAAAFNVKDATETAKD
jgi:hypothetical protein